MPTKGLPRRKGCKDATAFDYFNIFQYFGGWRGYMSINIFGHAGAARHLPLRASKFLTFEGQKVKSKFHK